MKQSLLETLTESGEDPRQALISTVRKSYLMIKQSALFVDHAFQMTNKAVEDALQTDRTFSESLTAAFAGFQPRYYYVLNLDLPN